MIFTITGNTLIDFLIALSLLACFIYMILAAFFESADRHRVVIAAKEWQEAKDRRNQREQVSRDLWDSVANLKRGHRVGIDEATKIPAITRKNSARARMGGRTKEFETSKF